MTIKLINLAKDLNFGIESLTSVLKDNGIEVANNPNARIDEAAFLLIMKAFRDTLPKEKLDAMKQKYIAPKRQSPAPEEKESKQTAPAEKPSTPKKSEKETDAPSKPGIVVKGFLSLDDKKTRKSAGTTAENSEKAKPADKIKKPQPKAPEVAKREETKAPIATPVQKKEEQPKKTEPAKELKKLEVKQSEPIASKEEKTVKHVDSVEKHVEKADKSIETSSKKVAEAKKEEPKKEPVVAPSVENVTTEKVTKKVAPDKEKVTETPKAEVTQETQQEVSKEPEIFRFNTASDAPKFTVVGKIDLGDDTSSRKKTERGSKRKRINNRAVDIKKEAARGVDPSTASDNKRRERSNQAQGTAKTQGKRGRKARKEQAKAEISEEEVQRQVKETLARLTRKTTENRRGRKDHVKPANDTPKEGSQKVIKITEFVTVNDLANLMDKPVNDLITICWNIGLMVNINTRLETESIEMLAEEFGFKTEFVSADVVEAIQAEEQKDSEADLVSRPPVVTIMGHVDHGKTSLLDYIRKTNVITGEAGGITQHIGTYNVTLPSGRRITFLDTPGHEAFTAMRSRGAKVTDIVIIIVDATQRVMPQTVEALNHAAAAGVPIVFAINKIDQPTSNPNRIKEELAGLNYLVEEWGGKYQSQDISAKFGQGVPELLEKVLLEADVLDLKANPNRNANGVVIESALDKGRGYVSRILVQNGTLRVGDVVLAGKYFGRVKALTDEAGTKIEDAGPSMPATLLGLDGAPSAGDAFNVLANEQEAKDIARRRQQLDREQGIRTQKMLTLDDIGRRIAIGNFKELNLIIKGDVDGSIEALSDSLIKLSTEEIVVKVIHKAVGQISESDVVLAEASDAIIIGFQVRPGAQARRLAEQNGVEIRTYSVIYDAIDDVKSAMEGMLSPEIRETVTAQLEVLQTFEITKVGTIAGCMVKEGKIKRTDKVRVIREGIVIHTGKIDSLKRFKDDAKEVPAGLECGLQVANFADIQQGDTIESFTETEVKKKL